MASEDEKRWNEKHAAEHGSESPSAFLRETLEASSWNLHPGKALDLATGKGRNAIYLAAHGYRVDAVDVSETAIAEARERAKQKGSRVNFVQADLVEFEWMDESYDLILSFNYLERSLVPKIKRALKPGGHILFETYLVDQRVLGHPRNPAYLLGHNELLRGFEDFRILFYREGKFTENGVDAYRASLFGLKPH